MTRHIARAVPIGLLLGLSLASPAAASTIDGTDGADVLVGTTAADTVRGHAGDDVLKGLAGADVLHGGPGADLLRPGRDSQADLLLGGRGPDRIWARIGTSGRGADRVYAGRGNDRVTVVNTYGWLAPLVDCGPGDDTVVLPYGFGTRYSHCEHHVSAPSPYGRDLSSRRGPG
jgi:hypothetical protein